MSDELKAISGLSTLILLYVVWLHVQIKNLNSRINLLTFENKEKDLKDEVNNLPDDKLKSDLDKRLRS